MMTQAQKRSLSPTMAQLKQIRERIDSLDNDLLRLLNVRAGLALEIGRIKDKQKWPVFDAKREAFVLQHVLSANKGPLSPRALRHIFQAILSECRRRQRRSRRAPTGARARPSL